MTRPRATGYTAYRTTTVGGASIIAFRRSVPDVRSVGDRAVPALARAVKAALERVRESVSLDAAEHAIADGDWADLPDWSAFWDAPKTRQSPTGVGKATKTEQPFEKSGDPEAIIYQTMIAAAQAEGRFAGQLGLVNQAAVDAARRQAALLAVGLSRESRAAIREAVTVATQGQLTVRQLARVVRDSIGLTPTFAGAVANYRLTLAAGEMSPAAVGNRFTLSPKVPSVLSESRLDAIVERYSERLLAQRATILARTESLRAAHSGQKSLWDAARADGLIPGDTKIVWQATPDDRECEACAALDGTVIGFEESWTATRGNATFTEDTPPIHPGCRCTTSLDL